MDFCDWILYYALYRKIIYIYIIIKILKFLIYIIKSNKYIYSNIKNNIINLIIKLKFFFINLEFKYLEKLSNGT